MLKEQLKQIGYISGSHGIKGEVKLNLDQFIVDDNDLSGLIIFSETKTNNFSPLKIIKSYHKGSNLILQTSELTNINETLQYLKKPVFIKDDNFEKYFSELVNFKEYEVFENDDSFGKVVDVMDNGVYELFKISKNNKQIWLPNVDRYVINIDHENKKIVVKDSDVLV